MGVGVATLPTARESCVVTDSSALGVCSGERGERGGVDFGVERKGVLGVLDGVEPDSGGV